ncbi:lipopolysaccharide biosynthesis protein [Arthrobacter sp. ZGTC131]|uniref:lipopolysaccharide biosynthesis protein n=1 Tax=Arthrobacter sp. ZGTC131 TaxID=2058898 RepID=UPI0011B0550F|nr:hypothetical protein [Arthrobacter sp. ZGTC131]
MSRAWLRKGLSFVSGNVLLQVLGFATGIIIVRVLSIQEYALYSIYIGLIFAMTSLSDAGVGSTLLAHGAKVKDSPDELGAWFRSGLRFRRRVGLWLSFFALACLLFLFNTNGASLWEMLLAAALMIVTLESVYQRGIWQVYFRLQLRANEAQNVLVGSAVVRLVLVIAAIVIPQQILPYLLFTTAVTYWLEAWLLTRRGRITSAWGNADHPDARVALRKAFTQVLPMNLVNVLRGQSVVFVLSVLGSTVVVSQVAALSRFSMVFAVLNAVVLEMLSPRIALLATSRQSVAAAMTKILTVYLLCSSVVVLCMVPASSLILGLLGPNYSGLDQELIVISVGSVGINLAIAWGSLNHSRLWLAGSWSLFPLTVLWGFVGATSIDLATSAGAALFTATQAIPLLMTEGIRSALGYRSATGESRDMR